MQLEPGVVVAEHYRLEELVGRGGMGAVWRATDLRLGRTVAMKVLHTDLRNDPSLQERFQREARLLASIEHPAIVPIFHLGVIQDGDRQCPCIVMPFVKGRTLAEAIKKQGRFSIEQAAPIMRALLDALGVAHATGVVHRDLKPHNVVLEDRGGTAVIRLLDFGIAKNVSATPTPGSVLATRAGMLLGTPEYMSPEQVRDPSNVDGRADLWAVGVILFEMLTGELPFTGSNQVEVIAKVMTSTPRRATEIVPSLLPQVDPLFDKLFDRNIDHRFRTALQLSEALSSLSSNKADVVPFSWSGGTLDPHVKNPGVLSHSLSSIPNTSASVEAPSMIGLPAASTAPISLSNSFESPSVTSLPKLAESSNVPEYFGAVGLTSHAAAIVPASTPVASAATPATSTQSGRTLTILALMIPAALILACAITVFVFARC
jgi:serine/threonine protein kinase